MKDLKGKTIKIEGTSYEVNNQYLAPDGKEEYIILRREIEEGFPDPKTIYDLGYISADEIDYRPDIKKVTWRKNIIPLIENQEVIEIATIEKSGIINELKVKVKGINLLDPNKLDVIVIKDNTNSQQLPYEEEVIIERDFFISSFLLWQEFQRAREKSPSKSYKPDEMDKILKKIFEEGLTQKNTDQDFNEVFKIFDDIFIKRF